MRFFIPVLLLVIIGFFFFEAVAELPPFGVADNPAHNEVSQRYLGRGPEETGAPNAVTAILFDYRAYDTLGEATVLFTAVTAVFLAFRGK